MLKINEVKYFKSILFIPVLPLLMSCQKKSESVSTGTNANDKWELVWQDEFNVDGMPDNTKWGYEEGMVRNNEPQYYTVGRYQNAHVANGNLFITAIKEPFVNRFYQRGSAAWNTKDSLAGYTSASLITKNKQKFRYGRMEVLAKMPKGAGTWPAIWLLGNNIDTVSWPACGEIDMVEYLGKDPGSAYSTIHFNNGSGNYANLSGAKYNIQPFPYDGYHLYALEWYADRIDFFYDSTKYYSADLSLTGNAATFNKDFYLLMNFALGSVSNWGGPVDDASLPANYLIDYIRVYRAK